MGNNEGSHTWHVAAISEYMVHSIFNGGQKSFEVIGGQTAKYVLKYDILRKEACINVIPGMFVPHIKLIISVSFGGGQRYFEVTGGQTV